MAAATGSRLEFEVGVGRQPVPGGLEELVLDGGEVGPGYQAHVVPLGLPKIISSAIQPMAARVLASDQSVARRPFTSPGLYPRDLAILGYMLEDLQRPPDSNG